MQGPFYGVVQQTTFSDAGALQSQHQESCTHIFPAVSGPVHGEEASTPAIMQLGGPPYPNTAAISAIPGTPSISSVGQQQISGKAIPTVSLQSLPSISATNLPYPTLHYPGLNSFSSISCIPNAWPPGMQQGVSSNMPPLQPLQPLQQGIPCYSYIPNNVIQSQVSSLSPASFSANSGSFSQLNTSEIYSTNGESAAKMDTHRRLTASDWRRVMDLYKEETPIKTLMDRFGISRSQVYRIIRLKGIKPNNRESRKRLGRPRGLTEAEVAEIRNMCKNKTKPLARILDELIATGKLNKVISVSTLSRILKSQNEDGY